MEVNKALTKQVVGTLYDDIVKYYGLYSFVKNKVKALTNKPISIDSNEEFWSIILKEQYFGDYDKDKKINSGQLIHLSNKFYLTEWAPKTPGKVWTKSGRQAQMERLDHRINDQTWKWNNIYETIFDEYGKKKGMEGGFGSVRINPSKNPSETFMYMSATTLDNWNVDAGIPIIVSKAVFEDYRKKSENYGAAEVGRLQGILILDQDMPLTEIISKAVGAKLEEESVDMLLRQPFLPKCFIYIPSSLNVTLKYNNSHPECVGWTMYKKKVAYDWEKNYGQTTDIEYGVTYSGFNPTDRASISDAVEFMKDYAKYNSGSEILTDFDGMESKFNSRLNLQENPKSSQEGVFKKTVQEMYEWVKSIKK